MALVTWSSKYSVGVKALDSQHTVLFGYLNDLHSAMMEGKGKTMTGSLLRKLLDYTRTHFSAEEAMLTASRYPALVVHKAEHHELIKQVENYAARYEQGEITLDISLLHFLRDWLSGHILKSDHDYSSWLNQHGVH